MKTTNIIKKLGFALVIFLATAFFNSAIAQKYDFKLTKVEKYEHRAGKGFGNIDTYEIENTFILDFAEKKLWNEKDKTIINITSDIRKGYKTEGETLYMFNFIMNDMDFFGSVRINDDKKKDDILEFEYNYFPEGAEYPSYELKFTYTGKTTELKK